MAVAGLYMMHSAIMQKIMIMIMTSEHRRDIVNLHGLSKCVPVNRQDRGLRHETNAGPWLDRRHDIHRENSTYSTPYSIPYAA